MNKDDIYSSQSRLTRSAGVVSIAVMISRVTGLVREMVLVFFLEARTLLDSFDAAYTIPNLLRDLFGEGILSKAFVSTFADVEAKSGEKAAWRLANLVFNAVTVILSIITIIGILVSPYIVSIMVKGKGFDAAIPEPNFGLLDKRDMTVYLTRVMFPYILLVSLAAVAMGLLNSKGRFGIPASASTFNNIGFLVFGIMGYYIAPKMGQHPAIGFAVGELLGGALQFVIQVPSMRRVGFRYRPILDFTDPNLKRVMKLIAPAIVGNAALQLNIFLNRFFASHGEGWIAWNIRAFRLMYVPIGVFGVAISTATLPALSRFVARNSMDEYRKTLSYALKMVFILTLPASVGMIALSKPIISALYERGEFGSEDTIKVAGALLCYAFGLCGYAGRQIATDGFIALKNMRTPVIVSLFTISFNILLNYIFIFQLGFDHRSLAISTACSVTANFLLVLVMLRRQVGKFGGRDLASVFVRALIASTGMGVIAVLTYRQSSHILGNTLSLLVAVIISMPVIYGLYRAFRLQEVNQAVGAIVGRFKR